MHLNDLDTPVLILDLDGLEDNLDRYQRYFDTHGISLRPHIKSHKCLAIAHMQMRRGAIGITCQKLGEAEVMVAGGIATDILVPYNIIGRIRIGVVVELNRGRTGVESPQAAVELGKMIDRAPGLELRGLMVMPSPPDVRPLIQKTLELFDRAGLPHPAEPVTCSGVRTAWRSAACVF